MDAETVYEVRLANGETEQAGTLWGARHIVARRAAFDPNPLNPTVLPAEIRKVGAQFFGGGAFVERIESVSELSPDTSD